MKESIECRYGLLGGNCNSFYKMGIWTIKLGLWCIKVYQCVLSFVLWSKEITREKNSFGGRKIKQGSNWEKPSYFLKLSWIWNKFPDLWHLFERQMDGIVSIFSFTSDCVFYLSKFRCNSSNLDSIYVKKNLSERTTPKLHVWNIHHS